MNISKFSRPEPEDPTPDHPWKERLEPFANLHWQMERLLESFSDELLAQLLRDCAEPNATNCWFATFDAAEWIKPEIEKQQRIRAERARRSQVNGNGDGNG